MTQPEDVIKELEKIANDCRIQESIITQMQIRQLIEKIKGKKR